MTGEPLLVVDGVRAGYGTEGDVLHGVDLAVHDGGVVALLGPNGAGKSTLLRTIAGFVRPRAGAIRFAGHPIDGHDPVGLPSSHDHVPIEQRRGRAQDRRGGDPCAAVHAALDAVAGDVALGVGVPEQPHGVTLLHGDETGRGARGEAILGHHLTRGARLAPRDLARRARG